MPNERFKILGSSFNRDNRIVDYLSLVYRAWRIYQPDWIQDEGASAEHQKKSTDDH